MSSDFMLIHARERLHFETFYWLKLRNSTDGAVGGGRASELLS